MCSECRKRIYRSVKEARCAHTKAGMTIRVYVCPAGRGYHVANRGKRPGRPRRVKARRRGQLRTQRRKARESLR